MTMSAEDQVMQLLLTIKGAIFDLPPELQDLIKETAAKIDNIIKEADTVSPGCGQMALALVSCRA